MRARDRDRWFGRHEGEGAVFIAEIGQPSLSVAVGVHAITDDDRAVRRNRSCRIAASSLARLAPRSNWLTSTWRRLRIPMRGIPDKRLESAFAVALPHDDRAICRDTAGCAVATAAGSVPRPTIPVSWVHRNAWRVGSGATSHDDRTIGRDAVGNTARIAGQDAKLDQSGVGVKAKRLVVARLMPALAHHNGAIGRDGPCRAADNCRPVGPAGRRSRGRESSGTRCCYFIRLGSYVPTIIEPSAEMPFAAPNR